MKNFNIVPEFKKIIVRMLELFFCDKIESCIKRYEKIILVKDSQLQALDKLVQILSKRIKK